MKSRLVVFVSHPIQYYTPLYRELTSRGDIELHVVYLSDAGAAAYVDDKFGRTIAWDLPMLEGYAYTVLRPGLQIDQLGHVVAHSAKLKRVLHALKPDAILLHGYASRMNWVAWRWARRNRVRMLYTSDSNAGIPRSRWKLPIKRVIVRHFFSAIDAFLCTSEANLGYLLQYGASLDRVSRLPFAVDVDRFSRKASNHGEKRGLDFIWAGKFVAAKRPQDFIQALRIAVEQTGLEIRAAMVGDGPLRDRIQAMAASLPPSCKIEVKGFVNQTAMPGTLQEAEVLIFTSEVEPYGLIATEAAAAGLALIVAERIGCVGDTVLARPGVNALTYPPGDVVALAQAIMRLHTEAALLRDMQQASCDIASEHGIHIAAAIIERVVDAAVAAGNAAAN